MKRWMDQFDVWCESTKWVKYGVDVFIIGVKMLLGVIVFGIVVLVLIVNIYGDYSVDGPVSPDGYKVIVEVSDCVPINWGSDYYTDVVVYNQDGIEVARYSDDLGSGEKVDMLIESLKWESGKRLVFEDSYYQQVIEIDEPIK